MNHATLGFRAHSGWAVAVALAGSSRTPEVIDRRRVELVDVGSPGGVQPYHAARDLELSKAEQFIEGVIAATDRVALVAVRTVAKALRSKGQQIAGCGIVIASGRELPGLETTLRSHAMVHTAEGELYRGAIFRAATKCGWPCIRVREKEIYELASERLGIPEGKLKLRVTAMGEAMGSPWSADEKCATVAAWLALADLERQ
jgi:hypothetical protein